MRSYDDEQQLATYIFNHYSHYFTPIEKKGALAVYADGKANIGSKPIADFIWKRHQLAEDAALMAELADGIDAFRFRTAHRVIERCGTEVFVNRCARCNCVVATPKAQQCLWCGYDWHSVAPTAL